MQKARRSDLVLLVLVVGIGLLLLNLPTILTPRPVRAPKSETKNTIKHILLGLKLYKNDTGNYPPSYIKGMNGDETLYYYIAKKPYLKFNPDKCDKDKDGREEIADAWGNPIQYKILKERGIPFVYSFGANGKDELGKGDDITVERTL